MCLLTSREFLEYVDSETIGKQDLKATAFEPIAQEFQGECFTDASDSRTRTELEQHVAKQH